MNRRLERFERRLAALDAGLRALSADGEEERREREMHQILTAMLRAGLECAGVDPHEASALRRLEMPQPPPKPLVHPLRRLAERQRSPTLLEALDAMTRRYQRGPAPDLRDASVMQLIGYYCFGDGAARETPA